MYVQQYMVHVRYDIHAHARDGSPALLASRQGAGGICVHRLYTLSAVLYMLYYT